MLGRIVMHLILSRKMLVALQWSHFQYLAKTYLEKNLTEKFSSAWIYDCRITRKEWCTKSHWFLISIKVGKSHIIYLHEFIRFTQSFTHQHRAQTFYSLIGVNYKKLKMFYLGYCTEPKNKACPRYRLCTVHTQEVGEIMFSPFINLAGTQLRAVPVQASKNSLHWPCPLASWQGYSHTSNLIYSLMVTITPAKHMERRASLENTSMG